jgi:hypothetical protein
LVAQYQRDGVGTDELPPNEQALCDPAGLGLDRITDRNAQVRPVPQQPLEERPILGGGNEQNLLQTGEEQRGYRVVDERLVIHRQELLADR